MPRDYFHARSVSTVAFGETVTVSFDEAVSRSASPKLNFKRMDHTISNEFVAVEVSDHRAVGLRCLFDRL